MATTLGKALLEAVAYHLGSSGGVYQDIVQKRFGLTTNQLATLESLAQDAGCTRERVRQIEARFVDQIVAMASQGQSRFPDLTSLRQALAASDGTWLDSTLRVEALLGYPVYLPGVYRLLNCSGVRLPAVGFDSLTRANGYTPNEARALLESSLAKKISASEISAWCAPPHKRGHRDAPAWAIAGLKQAAREEEKNFAPDLAELPQPELIRTLMRRSGFTRRKMMQHLDVNRSTFDRWLWPAENPSPIPLATRAQLIKLSEQVGTEEKPRPRHLGPPKEYDLNGIPGCARRSRNRVTNAVTTLYKTSQAKNLPPSCKGPWTTVCEPHKVAADWSSFAEALRAMSQTPAWCPDCSVQAAAG